MVENIWFRTILRRSKRRAWNRYPLGIWFRPDQSYISTSFRWDHLLKCSSILSSIFTTDPILRHGLRLLIILSRRHAARCAAYVWSSIWIWVSLPVISLSIWFKTVNTGCITPSNTKPVVQCQIRVRLGLINSVLFGNHPKAKTLSAVHFHQTEFSRSHLIGLIL